MPDLIVRNADVLVTMNQDRQELSGGWIAIEAGVISAVGAPDDPMPEAGEVLDATGKIVTPGLINTHHHLYQNLTRTVAQDSLLFGWLKTLYPIWARMGPEHIRLSALVGAGRTGPVGLHLHL